MLVNLKRNWFDPGGNRRRVVNNPHDLPDEYKDALPKGSEVLSKAEEKAMAKAEVEEKPAKAK